MKILTETLAKTQFSVVLGFPLFLVTFPGTYNCFLAIEKPFSVVVLIANFVGVDSFIVQ